jgi:NAD(P)-dependent dehydrogenase (short-subunit alcohol dehydrogenase family)
LITRSNLVGCSTGRSAGRARKDGLVINIASWAGKYTLAMAGAAYNGSKHAVVALTETLNMEECVNGIRACAICPAEVATPILDRRPVPPSPEERARMLQAEDLGKTIRWVAEQPRSARRRFPAARCRDRPPSPSWRWRRDGRSRRPNSRAWRSCCPARRSRPSGPFARR